MSKLDEKAEKKRQKEWLDFLGGLDKKFEDHAKAIKIMANKQSKLESLISGAVVPDDKKTTGKGKSKKVNIGQAVKLDVNKIISNAFRDLVNAFLNSPKKESDEYTTTAKAFYRDHLKVLLDRDRTLLEREQIRNLIMRQDLDIEE